MNKLPTKLLMVEDNPGHARFYEKTLEDAFPGRYIIRKATRMVEAMQMIEDERPEIVLLDLILPDAEGLKVVSTIADSYPDIPIVVLTAKNDQDIALQAVHAGAQDYLVKDEDISAELLSRSIRYAVERQRLRKTLREQSLTDPLTGLNNRRGFVALGAQQMRVARRSKQRLFVLYADVDSLKVINDRFGHSVGDEAIIEGGRLLKEALRDTDIVARFGGDEFTALMVVDENYDPGVVEVRLKQKLDEFNKTMQKDYTLSLSVGTAHAFAEAISSVDELLDMADEAMYRAKSTKAKLL